MIGNSAEPAATSNSAAPTIADRLKRASRARFVGRVDELERLERLLVTDEIPVTFVHGIGGIGKSALLDALEDRLDERARIVRLDGRSLEPTSTGFVRALARALGANPLGVNPLGVNHGDAEALDAEALDANAPDLDALASRLAELGGLVVLIVDEFDSLRLLDSWLRNTFVPALGAHVRLLFVGRGRPLAGWTSEPGWHDLVATLELGPLESGEASAMLAEAALPPEIEARVLDVAAGHPLALRLASAALRARPELPVSEVASRHVVGELVERFLRDATDGATRQLVETASVLRRVNRPLLAALLGPESADDAFGELARLPFVELADDGLVIHQSVRQAVAARLGAVDPERHRRLRTSAWRALADELVFSTTAKRNWQLTADILYLLDEPDVRDAFFPTDTLRHALEPARERDREAIFEIAREHAGPEETARLEAWWQLLPTSFFVARSDTRRVEGFYVSAWEGDVPLELAERDPLLESWRAHRKTRFERGQRPTLYLRAVLSRQDGAEPSETRAACFLDLKRSYMSRLDMVALYTAHYHGGEQSLCDRLGFEIAREIPGPVGPSGPITTQLLDFGPGILHWLGRLLEAQGQEVPVRPMPRGVYLCRLGRELLIDGERRPLTRLEFGLLDHLEKRAGAVCSRDDLLESVWGQAHTGSNVVDAVVRALRKKLGAHSTAIETVTGHGYRLRADAGSL